VLTGGGLEDYILDGRLLAEDGKTGCVHCGAGYGKIPSPRHRDKLVSVIMQKVLLCGAGEEDVEQRDVVPGDIVKLFAGELFPGDVRVLHAKDLFVG
jgi:hypothetical protein